MDEGTLFLMPADEFFVELCCFVGQNTRYDLDPGVEQGLNTAAGHERIRGRIGHTTRLIPAFMRACVQGGVFP